MEGELPQGRPRDVRVPASLVYQHLLLQLLLPGYCRGDTGRIRWRPVSGIWGLGSEVEDLRNSISAPSEDRISTSPDCLARASERGEEGKISTFEKLPKP